MLTTGVFGLHKVVFDLKSTTEPVVIIPFGDVHYGAELFCRDLYLKHMSYGKDKPNVYYLGMGDYIEFLSTSERKQIKALDVHKDTDILLEHAMRERVREFVRLTPWIKGRVIGIIGGNHYVPWPDGTTSDDTIAAAFGAKHLGVQAAIKLEFRSNGRRITSWLCAHHGRGAGRLIGSSANNVQYMAETLEGVDVYLMGHDHKQIAGVGERARPTDDHGKLGIKGRQVRFCRTGGFLRSMANGKASYNVDAARGSVPLGGIRLEYRVSRADGHQQLEINAVV